MERLHSASSRPALTLLVTLLVAASAAQAQVAEAPAAAASNASAGADNPLGGNGFITVQGNKFVDADCKVSTWSHFG